MVALFINGLSETKVTFVVSVYYNTELVTESGSK